MRLRTVTYVVFDGFQALDLTGPYEVFGHAGYEALVVAPRKGQVRSSHGLEFHVGTSLAAVDPRQTDTLIVAGGEGVHAARSDRRLID